MAAFRERTRRSASLQTANQDTAAQRQRIDFLGGAPYIRSRKKSKFLRFNMQVTRAGEYAIIGLLYLAKQPADRTVMIDEISEKERIPKSFLAKIFQSLAKGGFVLSHRGAGGGFSLAKPADEINLLQILNCIESAFALQKCVTIDPECVVSHDRLTSCALCGVFAEAQSRVNEVFVRTTLQDLLKPQDASAHPARPSAVLN